MANTIQLKLLDNKSIVAEIDGRNYAYEGGYNIVAGEENATEFEIASVPAQYKDFAVSVALTNSRGQQVTPPDIVDNKFMLPVGMAVAGYGQILITLFSGAERVPFLPLKIKVANTKANWTSGVISGTISIGKVETLPPQGKAYAVNVGTANDVIINFGIPEGQGFKISKTYPSVAAMQSGYDTDDVPLWGFVLIDTGDVDDEDNAKLYIKGETAYQYLTDLSGAQGIQGEQGIQGVGISNITANGTDASGGNIYKITLTDGSTYNFTAPKGAIGNTGATGNGIASTQISYASSTSATTVPTNWQTTIPTVAQGNYLWVRIIFTYTDGTTSTPSYSVSYQGEDGAGSPSNTAPLANGTASAGTSTQYSRGDHRHPIGQASSLQTARAIDGVTFDGTANIVHYATCFTEANTRAKIVTLSNFSLVKGARITVKFNYNNTTTSPTLNVNGTGAKFIFAGLSATYVFWDNGETITFVYDGTYWRAVNRKPCSPYSLDITDWAEQQDTVTQYYRSSDRSTWYRIWASGWKECGGLVKREDIASSISTVTFPISFASANCTLQITSQRTSSTTTNTSVRELGYVDKTTTQFTVYRSTTSAYDAGFDWYACGY